MKKIGILTFHNAINYGALLQAFALQKKIESLGFECEIIDYDNNYFKKVYSINIFSLHIGFRKRASILYHFICNPINEIREIKKTYNLKKFCKKYFKLSKKIKYKQLKNYSNDYYGIVVGSDQVWNMKLSNFDTTYYLKNIENVKKFSYAASLGKSSITGFEYENMKDYLRDFDCVLVREKTACDILKKYINIDSKVVLDPTLLYSFDDWKKFLKPKKNNRKKYILVYIIQGETQLLLEAEKYAEINCCDIVSLSFIKNKKYIFKNNSSLSDFFSLIIDAECVFTTSYHGMLFSILSHKIFYYELSNKAVNNNSRMNDICVELGLTNRRISDSIDTYENINYCSVENKLELLRKQSVFDLNNMLNNKEKV